MIAKYTDISQPWIILKFLSFIADGGHLSSVAGQTLTTLAINKFLEIHTESRQCKPDFAGLDEYLVCYDKTISIATNLIPLVISGYSQCVRNFTTDPHRRKYTVLQRSLIRV